MKDLTQEQEQNILIISDLLNSSKFWVKLEQKLGIELDSNSMIFSEIEEFILDKLEEMQEEMSNE